MNIDIMEETAKNLYFLHQELKKLDESLYENKKQYSNKIAIKELLEKYGCEYFPNEFQVIHRDIRPNNIIVNKNRIHFIDFDFVAYGDLFFEIGSSAMLISGFEIEKAKKVCKDIQ
ncbi:MAG: phosphotransferase [Clostridia bacterium]|nr:phosphotransferase [Clostridia bacterium]